MSCGAGSRPALEVQHDAETGSQSGRLSGGRGAGRRAGHRGRGQRVATVTPAQSAGSIPAITAAEVATITHALAGTMAIAAGRAWWAPAAGDIVFWAVTVTSQNGQTVRTAYGAGGPAEALPAAHQIGMDGLRAALDRLATSASVAAAMAQLAADGGGRADVQGYAQNSADEVERQAAHSAARYRPQGDAR